MYQTMIERDALIRRVIITVYVNMDVQQTDSMSVHLCMHCTVKGAESGKYPNQLAGNLQGQPMSPCSITYVKASVEHTASAQSQLGSTCSKMLGQSNDERPHRDKLDVTLEASEGTIAELLCTQAEALRPVVKVPHEANLLSNPKPHHGDPALCQLIKFACLVFHNLKHFMYEHRPRKSDLSTFKLNAGGITSQRGLQECGNNAFVSDGHLTTHPTYVLQKLCIKVPGMLLSRLES